MVKTNRRICIHSEYKISTVHRYRTEKYTIITFTFVQFCRSMGGGGGGGGEGTGVERD